MATVADLLERPGIGELVNRLTDAGTERQINGVSLVEDIHAVRRSEPGQLLLLTSRASASLSSHQLDIAIRLALDANAAGLVLTQAAVPRGLPHTARLLADRGQLTVLAVAGGHDVGALMLRLHDEIGGGWLVAVDRCRMALAAIDDHEFGPEPAREMAKLAAEIMGVAVDVEAPAHHGVAIVVDGKPEAVLSHRPELPVLDVLVRLVLHRAAAAAGEAMTRARRAVEIPAASRASLLGELVLGTAEESGSLLARARRAGILIDAWHTVLHLDLENVAASVSGDEAARFDLISEARRLGLQTALGDHEGWHRADTGASLTFVRTDRAVPAATISRQVANTGQRVMQRIKEQYPRLNFYCGVGGTYQGLEGLRTSTNEARAGAEAARSARRADQPVVFSTLGFRRSLLQWYSLGGTRLMVDRVFAPLDELSPARQEEALRTLQAYLAHPTSAADAAESLGVHRNTLTNRVKRLFELLDLDETNADHRLLLQLACRLRTL